MLLSINLFIILVLIMLIRWLWNRRSMYLLSWQMDGPFALPFIGNAHNLIHREGNIDYTFELVKYFKKSYRLWIGTNLFVMATNADDAATILTSSHCLNKADSYKYVRESMSCNGLFTAEAPIWKRHVKYIGPTFNMNIVYTYLSDFNRHTDKLVNMMAKQLGKGIFDIRAELNDPFIDVILDTTMGRHLEKQIKRDFIKTFNLLQKSTSKRIFLPWYQMDWFWKLTAYPKVIETMQRIQQIVIENLLVNMVTSHNSERMLFHRLLEISESNKDFTFDDIKSEMFTIIVAGSDTSSLATATTLLMLAIHPEDQQKVVAELKSVFPNDKTPQMTRENLEKLIYLDWCIKESLRLFPVVAIVSRQNSRPIQLAGYTIPQGTSLGVHIYAIQRDVKYWGDNADQFDPSRFEPNEGRTRHPFSFLAFSGGPRNCIGYRYAMVVVKMAVAKVLLNYRLTTPHKFADVKVSMDINTNFLCKHLIEISKR